MNIIHVFDPGGRTGYVMWSMEYKKIIDYKILIGYFDIYNIIKNIDRTTEIVVCENQHGQVSYKSEFDMTRKVGFIEGLCESMGIQLVLQSPQVRVGYKNLSKAYFKKYRTDYEVHNVDAFAHLLRYLNSVDKNTVKEIRKWIDVKT